METIEAERRNRARDREMNKLQISLEDIQDIYGGPEAKLWEKVMGEQIHVGGLAESIVLAQKAGIKKGDKVLDLCSALGAGLRFLVGNFDVQGFGLDGTEHMVNEARRRAAEEGIADRIEFRLGDAQDVPWPDETFDVVWGEDAWCYVPDKDKLISEAARLLKSGGTLAFSDWIEGSNGLTDAEAERICNNSLGLSFPYMESQKGYEELIARHGLQLVSSEDLNEHFTEMLDLYINILTKQLLYDALRILGNDWRWSSRKAPRWHSGWRWPRPTNSAGAGGSQGNRNSSTKGVRRGRNSPCYEQPSPVADIFGSRDFHVGAVGVFRKAGARKGYGAHDSVPYTSDLYVSDCVRIFKLRDSERKTKSHAMDWDFPGCRGFGVAAFRDRGSCFIPMRI